MRADICLLHILCNASHTEQSLHTANCTIHGAEYASRTANPTLHTAHHTMNSTRYTLHNVCYTLHTSLCTLNTEHCKPRCSAHHSKWLYTTLLILRLHHFALLLNNTKLSVAYRLPDCLHCLSSSKRRIFSRCLDIWDLKQETEIEKQGSGTISERGGEGREAGWAWMRGEVHIKRGEDWGDDTSYVVADKCG